MTACTDTITGLLYVKGGATVGESATSLLRDDKENLLNGRQYSGIRNGIVLVDESIGRESNTKSVQNKPVKPGSDTLDGQDGDISSGKGEKEEKRRVKRTDSDTKGNDQVQEAVAVESAAAELSTEADVWKPGNFRENSIDEILGDQNSKDPEERKRLRHRMRLQAKPRSPDYGTDQTEGFQSK